MFANSKQSTLLVAIRQLVPHEAATLPGHYQTPPTPPQQGQGGENWWAWKLQDMVVMVDTGYRLHLAANYITSIPVLKESAINIRTQMLRHVATLWNHKGEL